MRTRQARSTGGGVSTPPARVPAPLSPASRKTRGKNARGAAPIPPPRPPRLEPDVPYDFLASGPEEELLLHSVCEPNGAAHLRPHPAVRCGQRVNEVFG